LLKIFFTSNSIIFIFFLVGNLKILIPPDGLKSSIRLQRQKSQGLQNQKLKTLSRVKMLLKQNPQAKMSLL
jgi:hypothetical protein